MTSADSRSERRTDALTKVRIVQAAVDALDAGGVDKLTFRALATRLSTGAGAIYHYVDDKDDLLAASVSEVVSTVLDGDAATTSQRDLRAVMLSMFDAISARPWVGTQLAAAPWQPAVLQILERVGEELDGMGVPREQQFVSASVLVEHLIGVASQYGAGSRLGHVHGDRRAFLESAVTAHMKAATPGDPPFLTRIARELADHDDREQYRAGVDIILVGILWAER